MKRVMFATAGVTAGLGLVGSSLLHSAVAQDSAPVPPNTDLSQPVDVSASVNTSLYARSPALALTTSVSPSTSVSVGSRVTVTYQVKNLTADTSFTNIQISDSLCTPAYASGDTNNDGQLSVGETWRYACSTTLTKDSESQARVTAKAVVNTALPAASPSPSASVSASVTPTPTPSASKVIVDGTYSGSATITVPEANNEVYTISLSATVSQAKLTAITATINATDATSKSIGKFDVSTTPSLNGAGNDTLIDRALAANSASIASISGATYTSTGFKSALAAALTQAGY